MYRAYRDATRATPAIIERIKRVVKRGGTKRRHRVIDLSCAQYRDALRTAVYFDFSLGLVLYYVQYQGTFTAYGGNPLVGLEAVLNLLEVGIGAYYLFL